MHISINVHWYFSDIFCTHNVWKCIHVCEGKLTVLRIGDTKAKYLLCFPTTGFSEQHSGAWGDHHRALHRGDQHHGGELHCSSKERPRVWLVFPRQRDPGGWRSCWGHGYPHCSLGHPLRLRRHADHRGWGSWSHWLQLCGHELCCCLQGYCCYYLSKINTLMLNVVPSILSFCLCWSILYMVPIKNKQKWIRT